MRLVYITSFYPPQRMAGAELGTHFMAKYMASRGHEVHVLITRPQSGKSKIEKRDGYTLHWLGYVNFPFLRFFSELWQATKKVRELQPDLIQGNCLLPGAWVGAWASSRLQIKSVSLCYGYDVEDMKAWQARFFAPFAFKNSTLLLSATRYLGEKIKNLCGRNPRVFLAGYDDQAFNQILPPRPIEEKKHLLFIGRLIAEKGVDLLFDILEKLPSNYELELVGQGSLESALKTQVKDKGLQNRVSFSGTIANSELCHIFSKADCFVLPSLREPFGVVAIEALSLGVPVACSKVMGLPEAINHGRNGFCIEGRDPEVWVKAILELCENKSLRQHIYECDKEDREKFKWSTRLQELEKIYLELVS